MWVTTYSYHGHHILSLSKLRFPYSHGLQTPHLTDFLPTSCPTTTTKNTNFKFLENSSLSMCRKSNLGLHILALSKLTIPFPHGIQTPHLTNFLPTSCPTPTKRNINLRYPKKSSLHVCKKSNIGHHTYSY